MIPASPIVTNNVFAVNDQVVDAERFESGSSCQSSLAGTCFDSQSLSLWALLLLLTDNQDNRIFVLEVKVILPSLGPISPVHLPTMRYTLRSMGPRTLLMP